MSLFANDFTVVLLAIAVAVVVVVVVVANEPSLSRNTLIGVIVGVVVMLVLVVVVTATLAVRRRRHKSHPTQSSSTSAAAAAVRCTSSRSTTSVSTLSACNGGILPSSLSGVSLAPQRPSHAVTSDNVGYVHRDADEPPPPYSSLSDTGQQILSTTGLVRDRRTGRSLPPTPVRPPSAPASEPRDSLSEHIYDEPSTLFRDAVPSTTLGTCPRSSMSRVRLGTTALRPATLRCHSRLSVSRQRPRGFGTHQPRRSAASHSDPAASCAAPQPFFISGLTTCPTDVESSGNVMRPVNPSQRAHAAVSPQQPMTSQLEAGVVYDEPWDSSSLMDRVAIPLNAMPPRSAATLNTSRHCPSPQSTWHVHGQPRLSDWPGLDVVPGHVRAWPCMDCSVPPYLGRSQPASDFIVPRASAVVRRGHVRADSSDSSSLPLVTDASRFSRHCQDNSETLDLLSPTCV